MIKKFVEKVKNLFKNRKNFQITGTDGKKYWISRSVAVHGMLLVKNFETQEMFILLGKRGPKCPDEIGKWSDVCGYIDWDETLKDAMTREIYEETGLYLGKLKTADIRFTGVDDSITGENAVKQNITMRYQVVLDYTEISPLLESGEINTDTASRGGEEDEVSEIKLLKLGDEPVDPAEFAFNHGILINEVIEHYKKW